MKLIFEWDATKASENLRKHKASFEEARTIFSDPLMITYPDDEHSENEERLIVTTYPHPAPLPLRGTRPKERWKRIQKVDFYAENDNFVRDFSHLPPGRVPRSGRRVEGEGG